MSKDFLITIEDPERKERFLTLVGRNQFAVTSPIPFKADLPGLPHSGVYLLDQNEMTKDEIHAIALDVAQRFELSLEEVMTDIMVQGIPVLSDGCYITVLNPQKWF